jgi:hypothetical protein
MHGDPVSNTRVPRGPGIGTIRGFLREQPCEGDLYRRRCVPLGDPTAELDE